MSVNELFLFSLFNFGFVYALVIGLMSDEKLMLTSSPSISDETDVDCSSSLPLIINDSHLFRP